MGAAMSVAIITSVSTGTPWAEIVMPGRLQYCIRHGYTQVLLASDYYAAHTAMIRATRHLLEQHDLVWMLGADCLITNHTLRIEEIADLGPHMSICEEGLGMHALVNADSIVWRATSGSVSLLEDLLSNEAEWREMPYGVQDWLGSHRAAIGDRMKIMPKRTFNSCHNGYTMHWNFGDFVYHPCGAEAGERCEALRIMCERVVR